MMSSIAPLWPILSIFLMTFASEDLACLSTGGLVRNDLIDPILGIAACFLGIFVGDLGLWFLGRFAGRRLLRSSWLNRHGMKEQIKLSSTRLREHAGIAILVSRFTPGLRVPLYLSAGLAGVSFRCFAFWSLIATLIWTPAVVFAVVYLGDQASELTEGWLGSAWPATLVVVVLLFLALRLLSRINQPLAKAKLLARIERIWRWEFWPSWLFYLPLVPWIGLLALRYRSLTLWTAANPGIPEGGVVGESKYEILRQLPSPWVVPSILINPGDEPNRLSLLDREMAARDWTFPIILKPDASQRGNGLKLARCREEAEAYLATHPIPVIAQTYHPGPYEAGVFYYRLPGEPRGRIFSITDKQFPVVMGDGESTLEELVWRHPRYRMQAERFLDRHAKARHRVLAAGESFRLAIAGNHSQGTMFREGGHLWTEALEARIDEISRQFPGFNIGRFDVRYSDPDAFQAGDDLAIVELNGVTSESTNIYDDRKSLLSAYRILAHQWAILFRIGNAHRQTGIQPIGLWELLRLVRQFYRGFQVSPVSD